MLAGVELDQIEHFALIHFRQYIVIARLAQLRQYAGVTVELENTALGTQLELRCRHGNCGRQVFSRRHLAGNELAPNQLIQALGVTFHARQLSRLEIDVGRTDRLVRFLRAFFAAVSDRVGGQVLLAELAFDKAAHHAHGVSREVGRVGTHVGDVTGLVQTLGHHHGLLHPKAQAVTRGLLQGGSDKRRRRLAAGRLIFTLADAVTGGFQRCQGRHGLGLVQRLERSAVLTGHFKAHVSAFGGAQVGVHFPVFFRNKRADLFFTLDHQLHGYRLHTTSRQATGDLGPQQRRNHVTHYTVEEAPRLLGIDPVDIQLARLGKRFLDGLLGNFVEHHAFVAAVVTTNGFAQVPGNGFPLAIQVGCEIDGVSILGQTAQLFDHLLFAGKDLVLGFPAMFGINPHAREQLALGFLLGRQRRHFTCSGLATLDRLFGGTRRTTGG